MGQLVFTRLFYHHMAGQLQGHGEFKNRLFTYLDGKSYKDLCKDKDLCKVFNSHQYFYSNILLIFI